MNEIVIKNLTKSFANTKVLDDVSLDVRKGDIYGILGLSGAGKSTLVRCINGLERFEKGEIYFEDELLCSESKRVSREHKRRIAMIFQQFNLLKQKDVLSNVMLSLDISKSKLTRKEKEEKAIEALRLVNLEDQIHKYPSQLSGGQQQRVAIARALVLNPRVLLSDEATSALDPETTYQILNLLKDLNKKLGLTIIMISHQMNAIEAICNKVAIIDKAKIVEKGELSDVFLNPKTEIAKNLIYSNKVKTSLDDNKMIRILFDGNVDEPLISNIVQECQILVSIIYADTKVVNNLVYGQTIIKMPKSKKDKDKLEKYLTLKNVKFEEVTR